jgi:ABC-type nitrate/sulfonate/bicarbonate transport system substrate-binding protein
MNVMLIRHDFYKVVRLGLGIGREASVNLFSPKLLWLSTFWLWCLSIGAMAAEPEKLNAGYSIYSGMTAPVWTTKEASLFEKNGLNVQLIFLKGGTEAAQALITGDIPFAMTGGSGVISAREP